MRPQNALPTREEDFFAIWSADIEGMSPEERTDIRTRILRLQKFATSKLAETAVKETEQYDRDEVCFYISSILENGFNLKSTELHDAPNFVDAQKLTCFKQLIANAVQASAFAEKNFKNSELRAQRSAIARSKTLHDLRQNVKAMIGPLRISRELEDLRATLREADKSAMTDINALMEEIAERDGLIREQKRILSEIFRLYDPDADEVGLLQQIEEFKALHHCSDKDAAEVFGTSDRTIRRLRQDYGGMLKQKAIMTGHQPRVLTSTVASTAAPIAKAEKPQTDEEFFADFEPI